MKIKLIAAATMGLMMSTTMAATTPALTSDMDKLSYSIGVDLGKNFKNQGIQINPEVMGKGLLDGTNGTQPLLTDDQVKQILAKFQQDLLSKRTAEYNKRAEDNKKKGEEFLAQNKNKSGVVALPSGLQYKVLTAGTGQKPGKEDTVTVEYTGKLISGEVFDSSEKTGKPATFKLNQVIPGWTEALQLMPAGSTWEVYIPSTLAYGARSVGGPIGPNEALIFNIHLISVKK